jgi:Uma2 family endonuclease
MAMGQPQTIYYTAEMVRALNAAVPEHTWRRYETVHGELLVTRSAPRPLHQRIVMRLSHRTATYLQRWPVGEVFASPSDISWGLDDVLVQPDVFVIPMDVARTLGADSLWDVVRHLLLVAEVLSPSTKRFDRFPKRRLYQERTVPLYWIIDADERSVDVWTPGDTFPRVERERLVWHPEGAREPLVIELAELFAEP